MQKKLNLFIFLQKKEIIKQSIIKLRHISKFLIKVIIILFLTILFKSLGNTINQIEIFNIKQFFNTTIRNNSILIFERNTIHCECTPGFAKYFLDLGFNVDIIMNKIGKETFIFFEATKKLTLARQRAALKLEKGVLKGLKEV